MTDAPGPYRRWVLAARPRTLPAALVPVFVGATLVRPASLNWLNSGLCVVVALSLQIGTNFANDYSDGIRGADAVRVAELSGAGAAIGGMATSTWTGAGIGGGAGAVVGLATVLLSRGKEVDLRQGSTIDVVFDRAVPVE